MDATTPVTDNINPKHYRGHPSGIEVIDIAEALGFNLGNCFKYVARAPHKGHEEEDIAKARWYAKRLKTDNGWPLVDPVMARPSYDDDDPSTVDRLTKWIDAEPEEESKIVYRCIAAIFLAAGQCDLLVDALLAALDRVKVTVSVPVSPEDYALIERAAEAAGMSVAQYAASVTEAAMLRDSTRPGGAPTQG